ncbi:hypothetical protein [Bradyrhizobium sp.]|uniref:hypothetical protein n=1 Tax=Bradyrhizobium sp. TaxID=376 RepID=UPI0025C4362F|nr:hypothetical protein [Bradyrhizobium sp.]
MQLIATRHYYDIHPATHEEFKLQDGMYRKADGTFVLMIAGELPGDPAVEKPYSLEGFFEWQRECPEQIEPVVVHGGI